MRCGLNTGLEVWNSQVPALLVITILFVALEKVLKFSSSVFPVCKMGMLLSQEGDVWIN